MTTAHGKPSIVILHGWGLSQDRFKPLVDVLMQRGYPVYAPDFPGFGVSKMPDRPLVLADYAQFLHGYIKAKKLSKPILIGHSFGGRVSLKYNFLYPNSVRALILTGTPGFTPVSRKKLIIFITVAKIGKLIFSIPPLHRIQDAVRKWYYYVVGAREFYRAEGAMRETFKNIVKEELVSCMKKVTVPTLLLWGAEDIITPVWIPRRMGEIMPHAVLEVVDAAGHGLPFKQPEVFYDHIKSFIESI